MLGKKIYFFAAVMGLCLCGLFPRMIQASMFNVLVVMSYDDIHPFEQEIREKIDAVLKNSCDIKYFYMDTKNNFEGGEQKAKEAYALYQKFKPHGVIAADDNAQSMFVVPYLKDKAKTPVIFCGVNAEPEKYGYPASNVSGILERSHFIHSVELARQLVPSIRTFGYIQSDTPTGRTNSKKIQEEANNCPAKFIVSMLPKTMNEAVKMAEELRKQCDLLILGTMEGIPDVSGKPLTDKDAVPVLVRTFGKPTIGPTISRVRYGALCAIIKTGHEQGETSANMLLKAMQGTPVSRIPITRNQHGKAVINITTMKALGIIPDPKLLKGVELVRTEE